MATLHDYKGQIVTVTTADDQIFKGTVCSLDEYIGKIVLKNASTNGLKLPGLQNFFVSSIKELSLTNQLQASRASDNPRRGGRRHITPLCSVRHGVKPHLRKLLKFDSDQLVRSHCAGADSGDQGIGSAEDNENFDDFYEEENFSVFCQSCDKFRDSIMCLMKQNVIAVTFYGIDMGRKGTLSLIQVATGKDIFFYDILRLGVEGFVDGLQAVLESDNVLKIIHDCRMVSDLLYHQYQVSLANVFDTQVASSFVFRSNNDGNWPRFVESLPGVLMTHLGLTNEDVHHFFVRERLRQRDEEVWLQRPLCDQLLKDSLKNLIHMIPLYQTLQAKMVAEFHVGVQLYLDQVRNAPKHKVDHFGSFSHLLPFVFQDLPQLTKLYSSHNASRIKTKFEGSHGFVDVCPKAGPNMVTTSRDSIWHSKSHFCKASCHCGSKNATKPKMDTGQSSKINGSDTNASKDNKNNISVCMKSKLLSLSSSSQSTKETSFSNLKSKQNNLSSSLTSCKDQSESASSTDLLDSNRLHLPSSTSSTNQSESNHLHTSSVASSSNQPISNPLHLSSVHSTISRSESKPHCTDKSQLTNESSSSSIALCAKSELEVNSNQQSSSFETEETHAYHKILRTQNILLEKSALRELGSLNHSVSQAKSQSQTMISEGTPIGLNDEDVDKIYEFDMVKKVLKHASQQHSKRPFLLSKGKVSPSTPAAF